MTPRFPFPFALSLVLCLCAYGRASGSDLAQEYEQVRKIALRDARVREAFDRANERLEEKIVELDPALKGYSPNHPQTAPAATAPTARAATPAAHPKPKPFLAKAASTGAGTTHVVQAGDTLASLAARYHVSVASLETANHISDPRKLQVGQTLVIPDGTSAPSAAAPVASPHTSPAPTKNAPADPQPDGLWDKLKSNF
jgi:LysM repeat protein